MSHEFLSAEAYNVAQELRIFVSMHPTGCCLHRLLDVGDAPADALLTVRDKARHREHTACQAIAQQLLTVVPTQRHIAFEMALRGKGGWERHADT